MSIYIMSRVWQQSKSRNGDRLALLAIADFSDDKGRAWPSVSSLASKANMDVRSVQRSIARLAEMGELAVREGAGPHGVNVYYILLPEAPAQPATVVEDAIPDALSIPESPVTPPANCHPRQIAPPANHPFTPGNLPPNPSETRQGIEKEREPRPRVREEPLPEPRATLPDASRSDPMAHLSRQGGWPPVLGLGDLDAPVAELYRAWRSARYPGKTTPILPGEMRKDLPTLQEMHRAGITPEQLATATGRALVAYSRERVTLDALSRNWTALTEDAPPQEAPPGAPPPRRRITTEEAIANQRAALATLVTQGDGF